LGLGLDIGTKITICCLRSSNLVVIYPISIHTKAIDRINKIGKISYIIASNLDRYLCATKFKSIYTHANTNKMNCHRLILNLIKFSHTTSQNLCDRSESGNCAFGTQESFLCRGAVSIVSDIYTHTSASPHCLRHLPPFEGKSSDRGGFILSFWGRLRLRGFILRFGGQVLSFWGFTPIPCASPPIEGDD
jgi:hypothetical protein